MLKIEIEDLINLEQEIKLKEIEKKRTQIVKQFKKIDYIEREVRRSENKHLETFYQAQTIDIDQLIEEAEKLHVTNTDKRDKLIQTKETKVN